MPITKKQGAIFAIYADSPEVSRKSSKSTANPSPTKSTTRQRKALGPLAPAANVRTALRDVKADASDKGKKALTVFDDDSKKPSTTTTAAVGRETLSTKKREVSVSVRSGESPTKKTRSTPVKRVVGTSEALASAIEGSPASRTRSKTAASGTPVRAATARRVPPESEPAAEDVEVPSDLEDHLGDLVGDGRGALNAKKGKAIATYLKSKGGQPSAGSTSTRTRPARMNVLFDIDTENIPPVDTGRGTPRSAGTTRRPKVVDATPTPGKGKGRAVLGDKPLADVSEAYGASGIEPIGFRDVAKCEHSPPVPAILADLGQKRSLRSYIGSPIEQDIRDPNHHEPIMIHPI